MKVLIVYAHPEAKSYNHALFMQAKETLEAQGHEVKTSDLYQLDFDPLSSRKNFSTAKDPDYLKLQVEEKYAVEQHSFSPQLQKEIEKVQWCDLVIWQFPLWWFSVPAALKGWVDRVFAMGVGYDSGKIYEDGLFKGKKAMVSVTLGSDDKTIYEPGGVNGDVNVVLRMIHRGMLEFVGFEVLAPHIIYGPARMSDEARKQALADYADRLKQIEHESPIDAGRF